MRFIITTIVMAFISSGAVAQPNYYDIKIREYFDDTYNSRLEDAIGSNPYYRSPYTYPGSSEEYFAFGVPAQLAGGTTNGFEQVSEMLYSLIEMYEATGDLGYLYEFVFQTRRLINYRNKYSGSTQYGWVTTSDATYMDGRIYWPMSRFIWLVKKKYNTELNNKSLYQYWFIAGLFGHSSFSTFGDYANWLEVKVKEYYDYMINNNFVVSKYNIGIVNFGDVAKFGFKKYGGDVLNFNMQNLIFAGMAYLQDVNGSYTGYTSKVRQSANLFSRFRSVYFLNCTVMQNKPCSILAGSYNPLANMDQRYVLILDGTKNTYSWRYQGWNEMPNCMTNYDVNSLCFWNCNVSGGPYYTAAYNDFETIEDIGHGNIDIEYVRALSETSFKNYSGYEFFPPSELVKFRNTFTKNIYKGNNNFANNVDGSDNGQHNGVCYVYNQLRLSSVMPYMFLHKFDALAAQTPNVYSIIMKYYSDFIQDVSGVKSAISTGKYYRGLSQVIQAQMEYQCPNLCLRNRRLPYNQNFESKNDLIIDPSRALTSGNDLNSVFYPYSNLSTFIIENSAVVNFRAKNSIVLKSGFKAEYGTTISLKIDANLCSSSRGSINFDLTKNDTLSNVVSDSVSVRLPKEDNIYDSNPEVNRIAISPNPSCSGKYEIISEGDKLLSYEVYNAQGIRILRGENNSIIDLSLHANGVYICVVKRLKSLYTIKLIKNG
jgi:hypothetical protein